VLALHFARRDSLYARAINAADYRTALAVLSDTAKLQGLYPAAQSKTDPPKEAGVPVELLTRLVALAGAHPGRTGSPPEGPPADPESGAAEPGVPV
jgi:hypothetical protein